MNHNILLLRFLLVSALVTLSGCLNTGKSDAASAAGKAASVVAAALPPATSSSRVFTINNVTISSTGTASDGSTSLMTTIFTNAADTSTLLTDVCRPGSGAGTPVRACKCRYRWNEINSATGAGVTRTAETEPVTVNNFQMTCQPPSVYQTEIADGTVVQISVVPDLRLGNDQSFSTNAYSYTKGSTMVSSDFRDAEGRAIKNIMHYVCYDRWTKALGIEHARLNGAARPGPIPTVPLANKFQATSSGYSAESYYYDFYVRSSEIGSINTGNAAYECPRVTVNKGGVNVTQFYPLDSQFALAALRSGPYVVGVEAYTVLNATNGISNATTVGYAAKPNSDGTCPAFVDSNGLTRRTFRLRRYSVTYPVRYLATGAPAGGAQPTNYVYIMDRPVDKAAQDPTKPLTRLGPKPCPFSLNTAASGYTCTTALPGGANAINVDGTHVAPLNGCPIYPPPATNNMPGGALEIRPMQPWAPAYVEDTAFQACAFQPTNPIDPDIVLMRDSGSTPQNYYCAKHYPSHSWIEPPTFGGGYTKMPSDCEATHPAYNAPQVDPPVGTGAAINARSTYACAFTYNPALPTSYDPLNPQSQLVTPTSGCCARCSGNGCGGAAARNAASDGTPRLISDHPRQSRPNPAAAADWQRGCFDPSEDP